MQGNLMQCTDSGTDKVCTNSLLIYQGLSSMLVDFGNDKEVFLD